MKLMTKHAVAVIIFVLGFATPVVAGPLEAADAAVKRRDYSTAVRLVRPLAEQGDATAQYNLGVFYDNGLDVRRTVSAHTCGSACRQRRAKKARQLFETSSHDA